MSNKADTGAAGHVYVGPAGWHYDDWKGIVYPARMPQDMKPLALISGWFDMVEINVTFYRAINPRLCDGWLSQTTANPRFLFSAKLPQSLTHERNLEPDPAAVNAFRNGIAPLRDAGRLGAVLAQFPWSFKRNYENRCYLARLAEILENLPLVIEVRHDSWNCPEFFEGLRHRGIAFCNIDQPAHNACLNPSAHTTAPTAYIRLHGRNREQWFSGKDCNERYNYLYSKVELDPWIQKILAMRQQVNRLFVVTNNHYRGQAVVNALQIQAALGVLRNPPPETLCYCYPQLKSIRPVTPAE